MNKFYQAAMVAALVVPSSTALAQESNNGRTGGYGSLNVGVATLGDTHVQYYDEGGNFGGTGDEDSLGTKFEFKSAAIVAGSLGYDFGMIRADVEFSYARNKLKSMTIKTLNGAPVTLDTDDRADLCDYLEIDNCAGSGNKFKLSGSRARQLNAMANAWLDIPAGDTITPYVGGGIGVAGFEIDGEGKGKFAWQLGAGVAVAVSDAIELTADYRHREVGKTHIAWDDDSGMRIGKFKTDSFTAGLRFRF